MKFKIEIPQDIGLIHSVFKQSNHQLFLVGGCVRDAILNESIKDYDLVTDTLPDRIIELLKNQHFVKNILETGKAFGIVNVITIDDNEYEIATFREDCGFSDQRRPDSVKFCDMETDSKRRDLSINSLYYDIEKEEIIDLVGGIDDLNNKVIRTVGNAEDRFNEDKLRILRCCRFSARFISELDIDIHNALIKDCDLSKISNERIRDEFLKGIKSAKSVRHFLVLLWKYNLIDQCIFKNLNVNTNFIEEKDYIVLIAYLLKDNDINLIQKQLNKLTYSVDEVKMIKFLLKLNIPSPSTYLLKKTQLNTQITDEQILKYGKLINIDDKLLEAFVDYNLTITGEYIMNNYQLSEGKEVGIMMESLENQLFAKLLEQKSYEKGLF